jgi:hypothetical protein
MGTKLGAWMTLRPFHKEGKLPVGALSCFDRFAAPHS